MAAATPAERVQMTAAVEELERQYKLGVVKLGLANATSAPALLVGPILAQVPFFRTEAQEHAARLLADVQPKLQTWRDKWKKWAENGKRDDSSPYDVKRWLEFGLKDLAGQIQQATGQAFDATVFAFGKFTAENTAKLAEAVLEDLKQALPEGDDVLFWLKVAGVTVTAGALLVGTAYVVRAFK